MQYEQLYEPFEVSQTPAEQFRIGGYGTQGTVLVKGNVTS